MKKLLTLAFVVFAHLLNTQAQEKITFKLNPKEGKVIPFNMLMKSNIVGAQNMTIDMTMSFEMVATEITDSIIKYEAKYSKLKTDIDGGVVKISYDSSKEPSSVMEDLMASQLKPILESTLTTTMNKNGKIIDIDFPNVPAQAFDRTSMLGMSVSYANKPISIGESWESEITLAQLGVKGKSINTFAEKNLDGYKITVSGVYQDDKGKTIGTSNGHYIVDKETFFTKSFVVNSTMEMMGNKISSNMEMKEVK